MIITIEDWDGGILRRDGWLQVLRRATVTDLDAVSVAENMIAAVAHAGFPKIGEAHPVVCNTYLSEIEFSGVIQVTDGTPTALSFTLTYKNARCA